MNISESVAMVLCGQQCLPGAVASAFPMLSLFSFRERKPAPCLGSPFLCLAEPFCSFLFVLTVCLQGRDCLLSPHWERLSFAQVCGNSIGKITPKEALFMSLLRFALSSQ